MRLKDVIFNNQKLHELAPAIGTATQQQAGGALSAFQQGLQKPLGGNQPQQGQQPAGQTTSGLAGGGMNPAQAAQAAKERTEQKKQIQDAIKQKQQELSDLQKQLAQIG
jgi:hypothetical protein